MLQITNLSKTYPGGIRALQDVCLDIPPGLFGLLGPNGAGKSTLMRTVATLQEADQGSIRLGDLDVLQEKTLVRRRLGYLPQEFGLYPRVTAEALLDHLAVLKGLADRRRRRQVTEHLLRTTNLWEVRKQRLGTYSGGMRQRFGIAQALLGEPQLVIVDEPTAGLDPQERRRFLNLLGEIGRDVVVILSTHIVDDVRELCARMAVIDRGRVILSGSPQAEVARLRGRIWQKVVEPAHLPELRAAHRVLSEKLLAGRTAVRVQATTAPDEGFTAVEPDLEDVYLVALAEPSGPR